MKKSLLIFFLIFGFLYPAPGQERQEIDDLNADAEAFINTNVDSAILIAKKAFEFSEDLKYPQGKTEALSHIGFSYYIKGEYEQAKEFCKEGIRIGEENQVKSGELPRFRHHSEVSVVFFHDVL